MNWLKFLGVFLAATVSLYCGSVRLNNDSPFRLNATVMGADGTNLGTLTLAPREVKDWSDGYGVAGYEQGPNISMTPYTVIWSCTDGTEFSYCSNTGDAATVTSTGCNGNMICKPEPRNRRQWRRDQLEQSGQ